MDCTKAYYTICKREYITAKEQRTDMSIALWYCPSPGSVDHEVLETLIASLKLLVPNTHGFEPHLTVATHLRVQTQQDVSRVLQTCATCFGTVPRGHAVVRFEGWTTSRAYFRRVALECARDRYLVGTAQLIRELYVEGDDLEQNHRQRNAAAWAAEQFRPHVSLMYTDSQITQAAERVIRQRIHDAAHLAGSSWRTFKVVACEGPVEHWRVLGTLTV